MSKPIPKAATKSDEYMILLIEQMQENNNLLKQLLDNTNKTSEIVDVVDVSVEDAYVDGGRSRNKDSQASRTVDSNAKQQRRIIANTNKGGANG